MNRIQVETTKESLVDVTVVCSSCNGRGIHRYALGLAKTIKGSKTVFCGWKRGFILWEQFGIFRFVGLLRSADMVIFANTRVSPLIELFVDWGKVAVIVHDMMDTFDGSHTASNPVLFMRTYINTLLIRRSIRKASVVIANSITTGEELVSLGLARRSEIAVILPPPSFQVLLGEAVDEDTWDIERPDRPSFQILAIAGNSKNKCADDYFIVYDRLARAGYSICLEVYGLRREFLSANAKEVCDRYADKISLRYREPAELLLKSYLDCDMFLSLSEKEGYGMPVADAAAMGITVIGRDISSFREIREMRDFRHYIALGSSNDSLVSMVERCLEVSNSVNDYEKRRRERLARYAKYSEWHKKMVGEKMSGLLRFG